jgi:phosphatidylglycerophosphate synthase
MNWKLPNQLTIGRLALAAVFCAILTGYNLGRGPAMLDACFVIYIVAGITDILDGWLARRWNITSAFGRITDPFVDKVLVCGAFALLAGANFTFGQTIPGGVFGGGMYPPPGSFEDNLPKWLTGHMASAVQSWMVVVVIAREFVVSGVRGYSESQGVKFPASPWGKLKMFSQSVAICTVLYQLAHLPTTPWAIITKVTTVWLSVIITVFSGLAYVSRARKLLTEDAEEVEG